MVSDCDVVVVTLFAVLRTVRAQILRTPVFWTKPEITQTTLSSSETPVRDEDPHRQEWQRQTRLQNVFHHQFVLRVPSFADYKR